METGKVSSWIKFLRDIKGKGLSKSTINRRFYQQVEKEDYERRDLLKLVDYAWKYGLTKPFLK